MVMHLSNLKVKNDQVQFKVFFFVKFKGEKGYMREVSRKNNTGDIPLTLHFYPIFWNLQFKLCRSPLQMNLWISFLILYSVLEKFVTIPLNPDIGESKLRLNIPSHISFQAFISKPYLRNSRLIALDELYIGSQNTGK